MFTDIVYFAAVKLITFVFCTFVTVLPLIVALAIVIIFFVSTYTDRHCKIVGLKIKHPKALAFFSIPLLILTMAGTLLMWNANANFRHNLFHEGFTEFTKEKVNVTEINKGNEIQRFMLVSVNPPKHMYVTLKGQDGKLYENLYVSKHCSTLPQAGQEYNVMINKYSKSNNPDVVLTRWVNLSGTFCS